MIRSKTRLADFSGGFSSTSRIMPHARMRSMQRANAVRRKGVTPPTEDVIKSDSSSTSAIEVENALKSHPAVCEAVVFGVPDEVFGERVIALVELNRDASREAVDDMIAKAREQFADYRLPGTLKLVDSLPRDALGKIDRKALLATL